VSPTVQNIWDSLKRDNGQKRGRLVDLRFSSTEQPELQPDSDVQNSVCVDLVIDDWLHLLSEDDSGGGGAMGDSATQGGI
jgi:hypothetical protein